VAISPTGTGKTLAYLLPIFSNLATPASSSKTTTGAGARAVVIVPTRELAHQIHNECLKLAQGRKWKLVLFSKATANALSQPEARDNVGECYVVNPYDLLTKKILNVQTSSLAPHYVWLLHCGKGI
jgi:ATP-dependent RNA helicase DDX52/ROK1